jgi:hypothetical protein
MGWDGKKLTLVVAAIGCFSVWLGGIVGSKGPSGVPGSAFAAESLNVEGLPKDPKGYRAQVDQILKKADSLIEKLKGNKAAQAVCLDLIQTRDNVLREILKTESTPDGSKWTLDEGRASVDAMLKLLKDQYEKALPMAG